MFTIRYLGWIVTAVLATSWWYFPTATVWLLDSNIWLLSVVGKAIATVVPASWGGGLLESLTALVQTLAKGISFLASSSPRSEATTKILLEGLLILGEVKVVRGLLMIPYGWRKVKNFFRGSAKVVPFRRAA